ncbi:MAG TPA: PPC domain-containing protein [Pirellulales bacterium]
MHHSVHSTHRAMNCRAAWLAALAIVCLAPAASFAQLPGAQLHALFPAGGKVGTIVDVQLASGADTDGASRLVFSHPHITAVQTTRAPTAFEKGPQPIPNQFTVAIHPDVPPGMYEARCAGRFGVSNPRPFVVSAQPEQKETADNRSPEKACVVQPGAVVNGTADANASDFFKVTLKKDQKLVLDCWAERIASKMDATLVVSDAAGKELAADRDTNRHDPLIVFTAPADGDYVIKLFDFLYRGGADYNYRLSVSTGPYLDSIFPPVAQPGVKASYTLYGSNLPGGTPAPGMIARGRQLEQLTVEIEAPGGEATQNLAVSNLIRSGDSTLDGFEYRLASPQGESNPILISYTSAPVVVEQEPNNDPLTPQKITAPCTLVGRFAPRGDYDYVSFDAKKGDDYWFEAISQRLGLATDPYVLIERVTRNDKGEVSAVDVQELDDATANAGGLSFKTSTDDPSYHFVAPEDGTYRVLVRDLYAGSRGDPRMIYALAIRSPAPDFRLVAVPVYHSNNKTLSAPLNPLLRRGGAEMIDVVALRRDGFNGEIELSVEGLPAGVTTTKAFIPADQNVTTVVLRAAEDAPAWAGTLSIVGRAQIAGQPVARTARTASIEFTSTDGQPAVSRLTQDLWLSVLDVETAPFLIELGADKPWEMSRAGKLEIPIKIVRRGEFKQPVALTPLGLPPKVKGKVEMAAPDASEAKLVLEIDDKAPLGSFNPRLQANAAVPYRRDPQSAELAAAYKQVVEKLAADLATAATAAEAAKAASEKLVVDTAAASQGAAAALAAETQKVGAATAAAQQASEKTALARAAAEKEPANESLASAKVAAEKAMSEAQAAAVAATAAQQAAERTMSEAAAKAKAAADDKPLKEKAAAEAAARAKAAAEAKAAADKRAADLAKAAEPKNINVFETSTSTILKITAAPLTVAVTALPAAVKAGAPVELPIAIARLYGMAEPVEVELIIPEGSKGIAAPKLDLPPDKAEAKFAVTIAPETAPGKHTLLARAKFKFGGQAFQVDQPAVIEVEGK